MAIFRETRTEVYCDICGEYIIGWKVSDRKGGVNKAWAAYHARLEGCTTGEKIICKSCRIERKIEKCSLLKKWGAAGMDGAACMGFSGEDGDEPIEKCKNCIACTSFDWEAEKEKIRI